jgi:A/G-specific adenine glycosylase
MPLKTLPHPPNDGAGLNTVQIHAFRRKLMHWYRVHARQLPWRGAADPYRIWVSEVMLQQTRVAAVIDHYERFLVRFPTLVALALAPEPDVLAAWSGLGYYRRARMLHKAAQFLVRECAGSIPQSSDALRTLPGIGEYTAAAIASIAFGESIAVVDGNVERVLLRVLGQPEDVTAAGRAFVRKQAGALVPHKRLADDHNAAGDHNQAMMELGATLCLPRAPLCLHCPVVDLCRTRGEHVTALRPKQKSQLVAFLLATRKRGTITEVLLERRDDEASLMPGMYELPRLPVDAVEEREPILRLRHAITNTNYYVEVYGQSGLRDHILRKAVPASSDVLSWQSLQQLRTLPLTGLARKILMRADLMAVIGLNTPARSQKFTSQSRSRASDEGAA